MNCFPPAFTEEGNPYEPTEEDRENCQWAQITILNRNKEIKERKCSGSPNCASCPYHPQNKPRLIRERRF